MWTFDARSHRENFTNPDATGYFSLPNQAAGQYRVHVFAIGYVEQ